VSKYIFVLNKNNFWEESIYELFERELDQDSFWCFENEDDIERFMGDDEWQTDEENDWKTMKEVLNIVKSGKKVWYLLEQNGDEDYWTCEEEAMREAISFATWELDAKYADSNRVYIFRQADLNEMYIKLRELVEKEVLPGTHHSMDVSDKLFKQFLEMMVGW
jgi:hypothetical protein